MTPVFFQVIHKGMKKMLDFKENELDVTTYLTLRKKVGWVQLSKRQAKMALDHALYTVVVYRDGIPVGMGRVIGDGGVVSYIQDLVVIPEAQGQKIGSQILNMLTAYVRSITEPGTRMMLCLMCAKGREEFYLHNGFTARPTTGLGPGMITYIQN